MSTITIIGGHGKVARQLEGILAGQGHLVRALIRTPDQEPDIAATGATAVAADVEHLSTTELAGLLSGSDAVVFAAGAGGGNPERTYAVDRDAAIRSMDAAARAGVARYVMVSYFGARLDHGIDPGNGFYAYAQAKAEADDYLKKTGLDWTILAPSTLTEDAAGGTIDIGGSAGRVSRGDVAAVAAAVLDATNTIHAVIPFNSGSTPIVSAIGSVDALVD